MLGNFDDVAAVAADRPNEDSPTLKQPVPHRLKGHTTLMLQGGIEYNDGTSPTNVVRHFAPVGLYTSLQ